MSNEHAGADRAADPYMSILEQRETIMLRQILAAITSAKKTAEDEFADLNPEETFPEDYFISIAYDRLFHVLCRADPVTHMGGDAEEASRLLSNQQRFVDGFWRGKALSCNAGRGACCS